MSRIARIRDYLINRASDLLGHLSPSGKEKLNREDAKDAKWATQRTAHRSLLLAQIQVPNFLAEKQVKLVFSPQFAPCFERTNKDILRT